MEQIHIELAEVTKTAQEVRRCNTQLEQELMTMRKYMNELQSTWNSPAAETIRAKFNHMVPIFENYREVIENYAKFLDVTVSGYETCENTIKQNASSFQ